MRLSQIVENMTGSMSQNRMGQRADELRQNKDIQQQDSVQQIKAEIQKSIEPELRKLDKSIEATNELVDNTSDDTEDNLKELQDNNDSMLQAIKNIDRIKNNL